MDYLKTKILSPKVDLYSDTPFGPLVLKYLNYNYSFAYCQAFRDSSPGADYEGESDFFIHAYSSEDLPDILSRLNSEGLGHVGVIMPDVPELISEDRKYIFPLRPEYYHFLIDNLACAFKIHELDLDAEFFFAAPEVFNPADPIQKELMKNYVFLERVFALNNIKLHRINTPTSTEDEVSYYIYKTNNGVIITDSENNLRLSLRDINTTFKKYIIDKFQDTSIVPYRKVYLSRRSLVKFVNPHYEIEGETEGYKSNYRIFNEELIEEYLKSKGFEIFYPETFETLEEQIKYLASVKVLAGVTGSGLINQLFMPEGSTVIELKVEDLVGKGQHILEFYVDFAFAMDHTYIGLEVVDKQGATAVEKLKALFEKLNLG